MLCLLGQRKIVEPGESDLLSNKRNRKMVGYAKWSYPYTLTAEQKLRKESQDLAQEVVPPGSNEELTRELVEKSKASRAKHVDNEKDCCKVDFLIPFFLSYVVGRLFFEALPHL